MSEKKKSRGRPHTFSGKQKTGVARLIRKHGLTGTRRMLAEGVELVVGEGLVQMVVTMQPLVTVAREKGIVLERGRRKAKKVRTPAAETPAADAA